MSDTPSLLDGVFPKCDPLAGVTADQLASDIAAELGLQRAIEKDATEQATGGQMESGKMRQTGGPCALRLFRYAS